MGNLIAAAIVANVVAGNHECERKRERKHPTREEKAFDAMCGEVIAAIFVYVAVYLLYSKIVMPSYLAMLPPSRIDSPINGSGCTSDEMCPRDPTAKCLVPRCTLGVCEYLNKVDVVCRKERPPHIVNNSCYLDLCINATGNCAWVPDYERLAECKSSLGRPIP